jgi:hypothetical protein
LFRLFYEKYLPAVFWPVFLILISWGTYRIVMIPEKLPPENVNGGNGQSTMENIPFRATKPRLTERSEDGTVRWELWSEEIDGIIGRGGELTELMVLFTLSDETTITIKADRGSYDELTKHLEVSGNVDGGYPSGGISFTCEAVDYFHREKRLAMTGDVNLHAENEGVRVACPELTADLTERFEQVEFTGGVEVDLYKIR